MRKGQGKTIMSPRICEQCKKLFVPKRQKTRFCSQACNNKHWCVRHPRVKRAVGK